jgi:hypothetical protein
LPILYRNGHLSLLLKIFLGLLIADNIVANVTNNSKLPWRGGVAQWTSHPPQEQEEPGSNRARV